MNQLKPEVGQWYFRHDNGQKFEVVSVDADEGTIELQDFDGNLDEIELTDWYAQKVELTSPPEDLMGIFDLEQDEADGGDPNEVGEPTSGLTRSVDAESGRVDLIEEDSGNEEDESAEAFVAALKNEERRPGP